MNNIFKIKLTRDQVHAIVCQELADALSDRHDPDPALESALYEVLKYYTPHGDWDKLPKPAHYGVG